MKIKPIIVSIMSLLLVSTFCSAQTEGYYKDVFMDGGVGLYSKTALTAATDLNLSMEYIATQNRGTQSQVIVQNSNDENGSLLYPDGAPRFRTIYTNGGNATDHGNSLEETGRERIRAFYNNGGSYTGSCAGMFISSLSYQTTGTWAPYYHIWPGRTKQAGLSSTPTGQFIPLDSPLLNYFTFGNDHYISDVYHDYGGYALEDIDFPSKTEVLLRFDYPANDMHEQPSCWAYKESEQSGRVVVIGSHPEIETSGEKLELMEAILLYALNGVGSPEVKGTLENGSRRLMSKSTSDNLPEYTKIGDKQFHHFLVEIPSDAENMTITLIGEENQHLNLFVTKDTLAFRSNSFYQDISIESYKTISISDLTPGNWYVGVECDTTITVTQESWGQSYSGNLSVLNGVSYSIEASWTPTAIEEGLLADRFVLMPNYPNPFSNKTTIQYSIKKAGIARLTIYDLFGREIATLVNRYHTTGEYTQQFNSEKLPAGNYIMRLTLKNYSDSKILTKINTNSF